MAKKMMKLEIGLEIEMLSGPAPTIEGEDGLRAMTVRDVILQRIPMAASRNTDHATRLWNIGLEMDKAQDTLVLTELDFELLKNSILSGEIQVWARVNLDRMFKDAKEEQST